jgi:hypothetical protein
MRRIRIGVLLLGWVAAMGCAATLGHPTARDAQWASARWSTTTLQDLQKGRAAYVQKCAGCHNLHTAEQYSPQEWEGYVAYMTEDAQLTPEEQVLITRFLASASARLRGVEAVPGAEQ